MERKRRNDSARGRDMAERREKREREIFQGEVKLMKSRRSENVRI